MRRVADAAEAAHRDKAGERSRIAELLSCVKIKGSDTDLASPPIESA
jgi:hypothetical protein